VIEKALAKKREEWYRHFDNLIVDLRAIRRRLSAEQESHVVGGEPTSDAPTVTRDGGQPERRLRGAVWKIIAAAALVPALSAVAVLTLR
jgi:hypothetical protein